MARYIDAEIAIEKCDKLIDNADSCPNPYAIEGIEIVKNLILSECETGVPTAEVVPKSEVEIWKETADKCEEAYEAWHRTAELNAQRIMELEAEKEALIKNYAECMKDYAREIFEDIDGKMLCFFPSSSFVNAPHTTHYQLLAMLAELKKKYT